MNKVRREKLNNSVAVITSVADVLESIRDEEQDALDSMPYNLAESERALEMEDNVDLLDDICSKVDDIVSAINEIIYR